MTDRLSVWSYPAPWEYDDEDYVTEAYVDVDGDAEAYVDEFDFVPADDDYEADDRDRELLIECAREYLECADYEMPSLEGPSCDPVLTRDAREGLRQALAAEWHEIRRVRAMERTCAPSRVRLALIHRSVLRRPSCSRPRAHRARRRRAAAKSRGPDSGEPEPAGQLLAGALGGAS